jgi:LysR family transcriptional regulator of gallate degradation
MMQAVELSAEIAAEPAEGQFPNLRHLRVVESVGRLASISRAAQEVRLSQPAVTQAVAKIESIVGRPLFDRRQSGTFLTAAGEIYLRRIRRLLHQCDTAFCAMAGEAERARARHLTSTQIRGLLAVAESTSFAQASNVSGISTASLHRALRELEALLQRPLYSSSRYGLRMTEAGAELARKLDVALREIEAARDEIDSLDGEVGGRLLIGALPMSGAFLLGEAIAELTNRYPRARVCVTNAPYAILFNRLRRGDIDIIFGVLRRPDWDSEIAETPLFSDSYCIVGRVGHPLADRSAVTIEQMLDYGWIAPGEGTPRRRDYDALFADCDRRPRIGIESSSLSTIFSVLQCSDRLTLISRHEIENDQRLLSLAIIPFVPDCPPSTKGLSTRIDWLPTPIQRSFLDLLAARAGKAA